VYKSAIEIKPDSALGFNNIAVTYHTKKEFKKSIDQLKKALKLSPEFVEAHYNMGNSYAMLGQLQDALNAYNKAIELNPKYTDVYVELSAIQNRLGNPAEAGNNVGLYYFWRNEYPQAVKAFSDVIKAHPDHAVAHNNLAVCYDKMGNQEMSLQHLKQSASLGYAPAAEICRKNNIAF
jgi:tetratricopeptide (TPR) repeat protein